MTTTTKVTGEAVSARGDLIGRYGHRLNEIGLLAAILILYVVLGLSASGFLSLDNQLGLLRNAATIGIAAWGVTLVIIAGEIDISIGPAVAFASVIVAKGATEWNLGVIGAIVLTLAMGVLWGALAGWLRARFNVPSFITTLGLWSVLGGMALYMTDALPVPLPESGLLDVLGGSVLGVPTAALVMLVLFAVFAYVAKYTAYGRSVYATGGNAAAAQLAGLNVARVRVLLFATTGLLSAITGVLLAARLGSGNGGAAAGLEFDVIAAVVIGGTALAGGRGSLGGTFLGVVFITVIANGLVLLGVNSFFQDVVRGLIIVGAVLINVVISRRSAANRLA
ncbi:MULTISPECIES: ABC transporter permease [Nocardiopsis]|uniref:Inner-membrane translocator n=1 Tax=Nocardiopsis dassonvillei (strain ATCC 23218 / DSM 43111 / CIP 107115 / JCM 7437 / KCTC 9190 / NBRC 14626 / NCTC 10488 / NRRL B-5397 / IMRU 509) TaxID=446468 RepID=D7B379_NOCDD|nr:MULTISPECIES: ABC transporter permease [Nocardiopsis]ADH66807.1 inner-membrane translocator [Nocardiopsis dassonvillei subsp. dassonvillei DSM 43111]APC35080.1 sugar ABC transporter permease [Nocardiopsis dassonvillei]NKY80010.1 ABC transporter permease [Nocardiopsis dassonvillei]VEI86475.1 Ribose transport system permease protein rbsC [Nocardiopsis dassonvillei]